MSSFLNLECRYLLLLYGRSRVPDLLRALILLHYRKMIRKDTGQAETRKIVCDDWYEEKIVSYLRQQNAQYPEAEELKKFCHRRECASVLPPLSVLKPKQRKHINIRNPDDTTRTTIVCASLHLTDSDLLTYSTQHSSPACASALQGRCVIAPIIHRVYTFCRNILFRFTIEPYTALSKPIGHQKVLRNKSICKQYCE